MVEREPRRHLAVHLDGEAAIVVDELRAVWDPTMREVAPAHVTVVYPEETVDVDLLLQRAACAAEEMTAFSIRLGTFGCEDDGRGGVFVMVEDSQGGLDTLRDRLLLPPQRFSGYPFHATVAHPRTSASSSACWTQLRGGSLDVPFTVREFLWTRTDASTRTVLERFPLTGPPTPSRVAFASAVIVNGDQVLLGLRHPSRASFPNVWDLPGGHVEPGESARRALHRELLEELGIDAELDGPWNRLVDDELGIDLSLWLVHRWRGDVVNLAPHEHQRLDWFTARELGSLALAHPTYLPLLRGALGMRQSRASWSRPDRHRCS